LDADGALSNDGLVAQATMVMDNIISSQTFIIINESLYKYIYFLTLDKSA
jgi:hypothetical protein